MIENRQAILNREISATAAVTRDLLSEMIDRVRPIIKGQVADDLLQRAESIVKRLEELREDA